MSLVLTRRPNEGITITVPPSTEATVVHISARPKLGTQVAYAIDAPKSVAIVRDELIGKPMKKGTAA